MRKILAMCLGLTLLWLITPPRVFAQAKYAVSGVVVDNAGVPVIGASVIEQGTLNGVTTDLDGAYSIAVKDASAVIEVSYVGYKTVQRVASSADLARVILEEDAMALDDVVVIGYGTVKKNDMTGSVVAIKAEDINRGAVSSPDQMLQGKVPGLLITPASGAPGEAATIRIRGAASLTAKNDPLIVIDGVPVTADGGAGMGNPLASVNPNDIESYTVLKDASATAIYGSRASNGVIIITTKKGRSNQLQISYNSSYSIKQNADKIDMLSADEYRAYITEHYAEGTVAGDRIRSLMGTANTDWQDEIYRIAFTTDQNVSLSGSVKDVMPYRVSLGYNYDQATLKVGDNNRGTLGINLAPSFLKNHLTFNVNLKGVYQKLTYANSGAIGSALSFNPTLPIHFTNEDGSIDYSKANGYWNWLNADGTANTMASTNPLSNMYDWHDGNDTWRSIGNVQVDYKIHGLEDLRVNVNLGYDFAKTKGTKYNEPGSISSMRASTDLYEIYKNRNENTLLEAYLNYNKELGKHRLDVMAGYSWQHNYVKYDKSQYYNNERDKLYYEAPSDAKEYYLISFFGRLNYSFNSKYMFTFTLRNDASSRFSEDNRWGLFPSAALAWNIAEESFLKNSRAVSALKLRLGWGRTGQQDIGDDYYPYLARYNEQNVPQMQYPVGPNGALLGTLAPLAYNPNLKWETTETTNVGIDFGFLNGRINGNFDAYYRKTTDLLNSIDTPLGSNFGNKIISNIGTMENKGLELAVNFIPVQTNDMQWTIGFNGTWQKTEITKLTAVSMEDYVGVLTGAGMQSVGGNSSVHREGFAPYTFYMFQQVYDAAGRPVENALVDRDGDGQLTDTDRYVTGKSPMPNFFFGLNMQFTYKNWDFGFNGHGSIGNYAINKVNKGFATSYRDDYTKGYIENRSKYCLKTGFTEQMNTQQELSDLFIENASFFRMDDINVGYTFKNLKIGPNRDMRIRLAASVQNVFVITDYSGLDPELTAADGVDDNIIPRPRLYTLRLNINF